MRFTSDASAKGPLVTGFRLSGKSWDTTKARILRCRIVVDTLHRNWSDHTIPQATFDEIKDQIVAKQK